MYHLSLMVAQLAVRSSGVHTLKTKRLVGDPLFEAGDRFELPL